MIKVFKSFHRSRKNDGFSLIELVVTVGIMMVLMIGGAVSYDKMAQNTEIAAQKSAVDAVFIAAVVYEADKYPNTNWETAAKEWNYSSASGSKFKVWGTTDETGRIYLGVYNYDHENEEIKERILIDGTPKVLFEDTRNN